MQIIQDLGNWLSDTGSEMMGAVLNAIRTLGFAIMAILYEAIVTVYGIFDQLCGARVIDIGILKEMSTRIGFILGIIMFFYIIFSFIQMLISPDKINNKESGITKIVLKILLVLFMLGTYNWCFSMLYKVQSNLLNSGAIPKLILPLNINEGDREKFGNIVVSALVETFYQIDENYKTIDSQKYDVCYNVRNLFLNEVYDSNKYDLGYLCLNETISDNVISNGNSYDTEKHIVNFMWLYAVISGLIILWILIVYCLNVGIRMVQLTFLEIIAPMAIISYMSPKKESMFNKWLKIYFATYIDLFIRIAIINLAIFLILTIFSTEDGFILWQTVNAPNNLIKGIFIIIIIISILSFAKKAPDLIKELLPASSSKLGFGLTVKDMLGLNVLAGATTGAAIGAIGGLANGGLTGLVSGLVGGTFRGGAAGFNAKGFGNALSTARDKQAKANLERAKRQLSGARWYENIGGAVGGYLGYMSEYEKLDAEVGSYKELKADVEDEDNVKNILQQANNAYSDYYKRQRDAGVADSAIQSQDDWINANYKSKIDAEKQKAYAELLRSNAAFREKISMHNRRFRTKYNSGSHWSDINKTRKAKTAELEKIKAQKPKK